LKTRTISRLITGSNQVDGAGVKLVRVFGYYDTKDLDPFLMLDAFDSKNPEDYIKGFPWHPHRGIETVTYLISGDIEHQDSLGNKGSILDGSCQWMTAGEGIPHQEMPQASEEMLGLQLWINLPKKDKMVKPQYRDITSDMVPKIDEEGAIIKVISGEYKGHKGATEGDYVKATFMDVELEAGKEWSIDTPVDNTVFIYIFRGEGEFEENFEKKVAMKNGILFSKGEEFCIRAGQDGIRFAFICGEPLNEPIAWGGPIVMNTQEELKQAFRELDEGTFIK